MKEAMNQLRTSLQNAPVIWKGDYPYFIHPVTDGVPRMDPDVLKAIVELTVERVDWSQVDVLLGIEAMGLPLAAPLSMATGVPLVVARKRSYGLEGEVKIDQATGYSKGVMYLNDINEGERVAILEDVLSTGGTLEAVIEGVHRAGAEVTEIVAVVEKGGGLKRLQEMHPDVRIQSLVRLEMDGAQVVLLDRWGRSIVLRQVGLDGCLHEGGATPAD